MSNFTCQTCNTDILEGPGGHYITGCEHWPIENNLMEKNMESVIMPKELTAENRAKVLLIGEFSENVIMPCHECNGTGLIEMGGHDPNELCEECEGAGNFSIKVPVGWSTIKEIYKMAVENLAL